MNWETLLYTEDEKPLDNLVSGYSNTAIFRTMAFVGDSLSSGEFETLDNDGKRAYHDLFEYSWGQYIARSNGLKAYNFSRGGMTAKEYLDNFAESKGFWDKALACQAYVIALGANDLNRGFDIGSVEDIDVDNYENSKPTFVGYYARIVKKYKEISPDAKFFFVTFPDGGNKEKTVGMVNSLYALAEHFDNAYVIDLYRYGPYYGQRFKEKYYLHGHLNPMGYILTARLVDSYIDYIIRHDPEDFKNAGFIGTDIQYKF